MYLFKSKIKFAKNWEHTSYINIDKFASEISINYVDYVTLEYIIGPLTSIFEITSNKPVSYRLRLV